MSLLKTTSVELGLMSEIRKIDGQALMMSGKKVIYLGFNGKELGMSARFWTVDATIHAHDESLLKSAEVDLSGLTNIKRVCKKSIDDSLMSGGYDIAIWWNVSSVEDMSSLNLIKPFISSYIIIGFDKAMTKHVPEWFETSDFAGRGVGLADMSKVAKSNVKEFSIEVADTQDISEAVPVEAVEKEEESSVGARDMVIGALAMDVEAVPTNIVSNSPEVQAVAEKVEQKKPAPKKTTSKKTTTKKTAQRKTTTKKPAPKKTSQKKPAAKVEEPKKEEPALSVDALVKSMSDDDAVDAVFMVLGKVSKSPEEARSELMNCSMEELSVVI